MKINILDQTFYYDNNQHSVDQMKEDIFAIVNKKDLVISHINIDGDDVWDNFFEFISNSIDEIQNVTVVVRSQQQFANEVLNTLKDYMVRAIPELESLAEKFYNNPDPESWSQFSMFMEGLQWINGSIHFLQDKHSIEFEVIILQLEEQLRNLQEAVMGMDNILIADLLSYEFIPILRKLELIVHNNIAIKDESL